MKYFEEAKDIWNNFVPKSGQADTTQGELLRAVEKLRWESQNNGNGNWDKGFEVFIDFLKKHLLDKKVFTREVRNQTKAHLKRLINCNYPYLEDDLFDELNDRVVEYYKHYGSQSHIKNPKLYR